MPSQSAIREMMEWCLRVQPCAMNIKTRLKRDEGRYKTRIFRHTVVHSLVDQQ